MTAEATITQINLDDVEAYELRRLGDPLRVLNVTQCPVCGARRAHECTGMPRLRDYHPERRWAAETVIREHIARLREAKAEREEALERRRDVDRVALILQNLGVTIAASPEQAVAFIRYAERKGEVARHYEDSIIRAAQKKRMRAV